MAFTDGAQGVCYPRRRCSQSSRDLTTENVPRPKTRHCQESLTQRAWIDSCRKYASTINIFCSVVHGISKDKFGRLLEH